MRVYRGRPIPLGLWADRQTQTVADIRLRPGGSGLALLSGTEQPGEKTGGLFDHRRCVVYRACSLIDLACGKPLVELRVSLNAADTPSLLIDHIASFLSEIA